MKKLLVTLLTFVLALNLTACSLLPNTQTQGEDSTNKQEQEDEKDEDIKEPVSTPKPTKEPEVTATPEPVKDDEQNEIDKLLENTDLPINANADFVEIYKTNEIDVDYLTALSNAESITTMVEIANVATDKWSNAVVNILALLKLEMDEVEWSDLSIAQTAWENDKEIIEDELLEKTEGNGTTGRVDYAQGMMFYYRDKAIELAVMYYDFTGTVEMPNPELEAVG